MNAIAAIVLQVADGQLPRESGVEMIIAFANLAREQAEKILGPVGTDAWHQTVATPLPSGAPA